MHNIEQIWHKLLCTPDDTILIAASTEEGPNFCHLASQTVAAGHGLVVYIDDNLSRRQKAAAYSTKIKTGTIAQLVELKTIFTDNYGFTKAVIVSNNLSEYTELVIDNLAKGSVLMLHSQDPEPPVLNFSTGRLHYDQMTIISD